MICARLSSFPSVTYSRDKIRFRAIEHLWEARMRSILLYSAMDSVVKQDKLQSW